MVLLVLLGFFINYILIIEIRTPPAGATYDDYMEEIELLRFENEGLKLEIQELRKAIKNESSSGNDY